MAAQETQDFWRDLSSSCVLPREFYLEVVVVVGGGSEPTLFCFLYSHLPVANPGWGRNAKSRDARERGGPQPLAVLAQRVPPPDPHSSQIPAHPPQVHFTMSTVSLGYKDYL